MNYQVSRNGQIYGPYTLEDLRRYVDSGNVLLTDLAKSEEMAQWVPVSQLLGAQGVGPGAQAEFQQPGFQQEFQPGYTPTPAYPAAPAYGAGAPYAPGGAVVSGVYPDPPNLHWALVLLFSLLTFGLFWMVWDLVQVLWVKRVQPRTQALTYYVIYAVFWLANLGSNFGRSALLMHGILPRHQLASAFFGLGTLVMAIVFRFAMRASIEEHFNGPEPVGLRLGGVMTFFFGGLYFQYHFSRINRMKMAMRYGAGLR